jgi:ATP-binding cassette subfamily B protein
MEKKFYLNKLENEHPPEVDAYAWPISRLGEALEVLARKSSLKPRSVEMPVPPQSIIESVMQAGASASGAPVASGAGAASGVHAGQPNQGAFEALGRWIDAAVTCLGLEVEPVEMSYSIVEQVLRNAGPALILLPDRGLRGRAAPAPELKGLAAPNPPLSPLKKGELSLAFDQGEGRFLVLLPSGRRQHRQQTVSALGPDHTAHRISVQAVRSRLCQGLESRLVSEVDRLLDEVKVPRKRQMRARSKILAEHLGPVQVTSCWLLRLAPGASFWRQMCQARVLRSFFFLSGAYTIQYALMIFAWWVIGRGALQGHLDMGWLLAWALLLLSMIPFQMLVTWFQGVLAINAGGLLKQRLLYGALQLEPEEISHQGAGQLLGQVMESEALESLALNGGITSMAMIIELIAALAVLNLGAAGGLNSLLFLGWMVVSLFLGWRYIVYRWQWTNVRLEMTNDLVERMVGHRTRLAQERPEHWHDGEDQTVERYLELSKIMDLKSVLLTTLVPSGWLVLGLAGLGVTFIFGQGGGLAGARGGTSAELAIGLAGILLAQRALGKLPAGIMSLADTVIAWKQVGLLFHAAGRDRARGGSLSTSALVHTHGTDTQPGTHSCIQVDEHPVLEAHNLAFRYQGRMEPVIFGCNLQIRAGDQILLEGPSGGGKSTLASVLIGLRSPESGLLLMRGLDLPTIGSQGWRRRVVAAPQFHENHVLTGSFAFNLLMGRRWPPQPGDIEEAEVVCRRLGLGDLLDRMPAGLMQMVGETGWQLSHGERSRLYIARALLQRADLVILDESFAALDPESLHRALGYVLEQAPTLLVIAHP